MKNTYIYIYIDFVDRFLFEKENARIISKISSRETRRIFNKD